MPGNSNNNKLIIRLLQLQPGVSISNCLSSFNRPTLTTSSSVVTKPQLYIQQQQLIARQRQQQAQRQAMLAQQYSGVPMGLPNRMNQMTQAQFHAMRGNPMARPVNLPQHLQAQQQQQQHQVRIFPNTLFYVLDQANMSSISSNS